MSSGSKQIVQIAKETVNGTTPSPFARNSIPFTEITLDAAATKEDSNSILDSRLAQKGSITGIDYTGDLNGEFRYGIFDDLMAAAAFNNWAADVPAVGEDTLTFGGTTRQSFSILRGYTDINNYHTFKGVHVNTMNISIPEQGLVTIGFGLMGKGRTVSGTLPTGTVTTPTLTPVFSSVSVGDILIDGVSQVGVACITSFDFTWDNTMQVQRCLGAGLDIGAIIETLANGTGSFTAAWSANAATNYEKQFTNTTIGLQILLTDAETGGNEYVLTLPKVEITASLPSGGNSDILQATFDYRVVEEAPTIVRTPAA